MAKRKVFDELMEGVAAMKAPSPGQAHARSYKSAAKPLPKVDSKLIRQTRERLRCSRAVFARKLHINERREAAADVAGHHRFLDQPRGSPRHVSGSVTFV